ncbi:MAG: leucine-rich repeat protein [Mycoplasma sp.]
MKIKKLVNFGLTLLGLSSLITISINLKNYCNASLKQTSTNYKHVYSSADNFVYENISGIGTVISGYRDASKMYQVTDLIIPAKSNFGTDVVGIKDAPEVPPGSEKWRWELAVFYGLQNLRTVSFENKKTFKRLGLGAFAGCPNLETIDLPLSMDDVGTYAFRNDTSLRKIVLPTGITTIGKATFWKCSNLEEFKISGTVTNIEAGAFQECTSLSEIDIPESVTTIGKAAFAGCNNLYKIHLNWNTREMNEIIIPKIKHSDVDETFLGIFINKIKKSKSVRVLFDKPDAWILINPELEKEEGLLDLYKKNFADCTWSDIAPTYGVGIETASAYFGFHEPKNMLPIILGATFGGITLIGLIGGFIWYRKRKSINA